MLQTRRTEHSPINRIAISERASLEEVDRPSPYSAISISVTINATMTSEVGNTIQGSNRPQASAVSFLVAAREIKDGEEHWSRNTAQIFGRK